MSEVEKLRALLAEARVALSRECFSGECCGIRRRIDAALAESYHVPLDKRCTRAGCGAEADTTNHWTPEYDYLDERNIKHYAPCPLTKDAP